MTIECQNCGLCDDYTTKVSGPHLTAICNGCGKYIKHLPQKKPLTIYFGKYKGRELSSLIDPEEIKYLKWLTNSEGIKPKLKEAVDAHLSAL